MTKYKVFRAHLGFYDTIVAAPSKKAALEAWHSKPSLFDQGFAEEIHDPDLVKIATKMPRVVFRKVKGSREKFEPDPKWGAH
jgi:hypothetical protein